MREARVIGNAKDAAEIKWRKGKTRE